MTKKTESHIENPLREANRQANKTLSILTNRSAATQRAKDGSTAPSKPRQQANKN